MHRAPLTSPCSASIVLFGLLPLQRTRTDWPHAEYNGKVAATNQQLQAFVQQQGSEELKFKGGCYWMWLCCRRLVRHPMPHLPLSEYIRADCGGDFLLANATVDLRLMPDGIHPAGEKQAGRRHCRKSTSFSGNEGGPPLLLIPCCAGDGARVLLSCMLQALGD